MPPFTINQYRDVITKATNRARIYKESAEKFLSTAITLSNYTSPVVSVLANKRSTQ